MTKITFDKKAKYGSRYGNHLLREAGIIPADERWHVKRVGNLVADIRQENYLDGKMSKKESIEYLFELFVNNKSLTD